MNSRVSSSVGSSELRQRRPIVEDVARVSATNEDTDCASDSFQVTQQVIRRVEVIRIQPKRQYMRTCAGVFIGIIYIVFLVLFNPLTFRYWIKHMFPTFSSKNSLSYGHCATSQTTRLVFVRIPKTASTSILRLLEKQSTIVNLGELEGEIVSSIAVNLSNATEGWYVKRQIQGYHDPASLGVVRSRFYQHAVKKILHPPSPHKPRHLFQGHFHVVENWKNLIETWNPPGKQGILKSLIPQGLQHLYGINDPKLDEIPQFTFMRHPVERYASMYHYDRHATRTVQWRNHYAQTHHGNLTLNQCLKNEDCIDANQVLKWCNLQTQVLCGTGTECEPPHTPQALLKAKRHMERSMMLVGVLERLHESLELLSSLAPQYFAFHANSQIPHVRISLNMEPLTAQSKEILNKYCRNDLQLYHHANDLLNLQHYRVCRTESP